MTNEEVREDLARRVFAASDGYKTKDNKQQKRTCARCSKTFHGRSDAKTCGEACRKALDKTT